MSPVAALLLAGAVPGAAATPDCSYDRTILDLGIDAFDQDMQGGWRTVGGRPGCEAKAADIVRAYREKQQRRLPILYFHEGQLRAEAGDYESAIPLMMKARDLDGAAPGWTAFVDATIAFVRRDRPALERASADLAATPKPANWPAEARWPMNADAVAGMLRCFDRPYRDAMATDCRPQTPRD